MEHLVPLLAVAAAAFGAACLTFFSGFGLGTLLMPVFALFFPVEEAIACTALVHFLNNVFKLALVSKNTDTSVVLRFGLPAVAFAFLGAFTLVWLSSFPPLLVYAIAGKTARVDVVKVAVALTMIAFALLEVSPRFESRSFDRKWLPLGGAFSGFFGGLSGHQGALRSAFLIRLGLSKEAFIGTGVTIACLVDLTRLSVYFSHYSGAGGRETRASLVTATLCAFAGSVLGRRLLRKVTVRGVQWTVSAMLFVIAFLLLLGLI